MGLTFNLMGFGIFFAGKVVLCGKLVLGVNPEVYCFRNVLIMCCTNGHCFGINVCATCTALACQDSDSLKLEA